MFHIGRIQKLDVKKRLEKDNKMKKRIAEIQKTMHLLIILSMFAVSASLS